MPELVATGRLQLLGAGADRLHQRRRRRGHGERLLRVDGFDNRAFARPLHYRRRLRRGEGVRVRRPVVHCVDADCTSDGDAKAAAVRDGDTEPDCGDIRYICQTPEASALG